MILPLQDGAPICMIFETDDLGAEAIHALGIHSEIQKCLNSVHTSYTSAVLNNCVLCKWYRYFYSVSEMVQTGTILEFIIPHTNVGVNGEALQLHAVYKKPYFFITSHARIRIRYCKSHKNLYQVLQVTCTASEHAMKSKVSLSP